MLSRVANSIYWMNRYIERAENYARLIQVNHNMILDLPSGINAQWQPLIMTTGDNALFQSKYSDKYTRKNVVNFLAADQINSNSIISCIALARENARTVREIISHEMWMQINEMYLSAKQAMNANYWAGINLEDFLTDVIKGCHTYWGTMEATLTHSEGWYFGFLGKCLERADKTARILDMKYFYLLPSAKHIGSPLDMLHWSALLKSAGAHEMYKQMHNTLNIPNIIQFLILNRQFPRSIHYCMIKAETAIHKINGSELNTFKSISEKLIGKLRSGLDFTDIDDIMEKGLHEYIVKTEKKLVKIDKAINTCFTLH